MIKTMNTVSQTFNWSRFVATLRKEVVENRRTILFSVIGIYAMLAIIMILGNLTTGTPAENAIVMSTNIPYSVVFMLLSFVVCAISSMAFKSMTTKAGRTSLMMSPSSSLEKFVVNLLIYVVAMFVLFFACTQLADLTRIAVLKPFETKNFVVPGSINFANVKTFTFMADGSSSNSFVFWVGMSLFIGTIANAAMYFLGSVVWPRLSLLKTFVTIFAAQSTLLIILIVLINVCAEPHVFGQWFRDFMKSGGFFKLSCAISPVLAVGAFALSWILFKRKDVVSLKWWK